MCVVCPEECAMHGRVLYPYKTVCTGVFMIIGSILNPLAGKFSEATRKKGKGTKTGISRLAELLFVAI